MTRLLYLPDDATVIQLEVQITPSQLTTAVNAGMRPLVVLKSAPPGKLNAIHTGTTVIIIPGGESISLKNKPELSKRQAQVIELSARSLSIGEIAMLMNLSRRTVNYHVSMVKERIRAGILPAINALTSSGNAGDND
jgi:DNA-binding CsgD family transcriptional regulator